MCLFKKKKKKRPVLTLKEGHHSGRGFGFLATTNGDHLYFPGTDFFSVTTLSGDWWHSPAGPCRSSTLTGHYEKTLFQGHWLSEATSWPATALQSPGSSCQSGRCCPHWATCHPAAARSRPSGALQLDKSLCLSDLFSKPCYANSITRVCPITAG